MTLVHLAGNAKTELSGIDDDMVQSNAVDVRIDRVFAIKNEPFVITNEKKRHRTTEEVFPDSYGMFELGPGSYEIVMDGYVHVGEGEAGWVITRSTLNRNGCFITSGLYDSKYFGTMAACLHINGGSMFIEHRTRVGQFVTVQAEMLHEYNGDYGFDKDGVPKPMEEKYHK